MNILDITFKTLWFLGLAALAAGAILATAYLAHLGWNLAS